MRVAVDGEALVFRGLFKRGKAVVKFIHRCCRCGLRHNVEIKHNGSDPDVSIVFDRLES